MYPKYDRVFKKMSVLDQFITLNSIVGIWKITSLSQNNYVFCRLLEVRGRLYELLTHCIPPEIIMKVT